MPIVLLVFMAAIAPLREWIANGDRIAASVPRRKSLH
jgi:hypothetical protein